MNAPNVVKFPRKRKGWTRLPALYTFAFTTLVGPAIAAAILGLIYLVSGTLGLGPPSLKALKAGELLPYTAQRVLDGYIWSAIPAGITGAVLAWLVYKTGNFHWLWAVLAAAVSATLMAVATGGQASIHTTFIALIAGASAVLGRLLLAATGVIALEVESGG